MSERGVIGLMYLIGSVVIIWITARAMIDHSRWKREHEKWLRKRKNPAS